MIAILRFDFSIIILIINEFLDDWLLTTELSVVVMNLPASWIFRLSIQMYRKIMCVLTKVLQILQLILSKLFLKASPVYIKSRFLNIFDLLFQSIFQIL